jgi:hypothetical protein
VAAPAPRSGRRLTWLWLGVGAVVVLGLALTVVTLLLRPATSAAGPAASAETPAPAASVTAPSPTPSPAAQQEQRYRAYVSIAVTNGTALAGSLAGLEDCRVGRAECKQRIAQASSQVDQFQRALSANPAPACLSGADQRLRDGLTFQGRGLGLAEQAVDSRNRLELAQGLLLVSAGTWREGQAIWSARHSDC